MPPKISAAKAAARQRMLAHYADVGADELEEAKGYRGPDEEGGGEAVFVDDGRELGDVHQVARHKEDSAARHRAVKQRRTAKVMADRKYARAKELGIKRHHAQQLFERLSKEVWVPPSVPQVRSGRFVCETQGKKYSLPLHRPWEFSAVQCTQVE